MKFAGPQGNRLYYPLYSIQYLDIDLDKKN